MSRGVGLHLPWIFPNIMTVRGITETWSGRNTHIRIRTHTHIFVPVVRVDPHFLLVVIIWLMVASFHQILRDSYWSESMCIFKGKCSHGGVYDQTSRTEPTGGINKDTNSSSHGQLHRTAADLAVDATVDLLEDIRVAIGDRTFLR